MSVSQICASTAVALSISSQNNYITSHINHPFSLFSSLFDIKAREKNINNINIRSFFLYFLEYAFYCSINLLIFSNQNGGSKMPKHIGSKPVISSLCGGILLLALHLWTYLCVPSHILSVSKFDLISFFVLLSSLQLLLLLTCLRSSVVILSSPKVFFYLLSLFINITNWI